MNFTTVQWGSMVQAILVLSRLTFLMSSNLGWDAETTRSNIPMVMYLDCICYRLQHLSSDSSETAETPKNPGVRYVFSMILGSVKKSYERRVSKIEPGFMMVDPGNVIGVARGHCPIHDPTLKSLLDLSDSTDGSSFELGEGSSPSVSTPPNMPLYHDVWSTMTCSWANET